MKSKANKKISKKVAKKAIKRIDPSEGETDPARMKSLQKLSLSVGNFIRYWGFRRIHGALWTQIYVSNRPLSCTDLTERLGMSKALISPALEELCHHKLIFEAPAPNEKVKVYAAHENINDVIRHVLKTREAQMLKEVTESFESFEKTEGKTSHVDRQRVEALERMISSANLMLHIMVGQEDLLELPLKEFQ